MVVSSSAPTSAGLSFGGDCIIRCSSASAIVETAPSRAGPVCREMPANRSFASVSRAWRPGHSVRSPVLRFGQQGESVAAYASPGEGPPFQPRVTLPPAYSPFLLPLRPSPLHTYPTAYKHRSSAVVTRNKKRKISTQEQDRRVRLPEIFNFNLGLYKSPPPA